ncbi:AhpC/TSA family protein [Sphingomonas ginkgonis]|uniref:AhpC/TSA family protein n=1 Tax=Sphingomonas ginkgonis TaxID=2315330 RepID=A0A3S0EMZ6_9SPHN|nr:peroxiredoxin-like family protein [Sphingomonas ginkgonis]RST31263.1 AhpC/TSA family protein [Sphingomonas ginkgonis]
MTHPFVTRLEQVYQLVRNRGDTLGERLRAVADVVRDEAPDFCAEVDRFVGRLETVRAGSSAPQVGDPMPLFTMPDQDGHLVGLEELLAQGPVVLAFHRGHWCPYCRLNMVGLAEIEDRVRPARIIGISAETQRYTRELRQDAGACFPILTDLGGGYALSLNLVVWVDRQMSQMIEGAGWDIPLYQGGTDWILPIPAVFVVAQDGTIVERHVDPDYRRRMELDDLLRGVDKLRDEPVAPVGRAQQVEQRASLA